MNNAFEDFVLKAKDVADAATKKTGELYEVSRLKCECIKLNGEIKRLYEQLGSSVYSMKKNHYDNQELIDSLSEEIDELQEKLKKLNAEIAGKKTFIVCPVCGGKNEACSDYCVKCGTRLYCETVAEDDIDEDFSQDAE